MSEPERRALLEGRHANPHELLGVHPDGDEFVLRTIQPRATAVHAIVGETERPLRRRVGNLFETRLEELPIRPYHLRVTAEGGSDRIEYDPYQFPPSIGELDVHLYGEGRHNAIFNALGAREHVVEMVRGTAFSVWAPAANAVALVGDFNEWNVFATPMRALGSSGIWEIFVPSIDPESDARYKFSILSADGMRRLRADPLARATEAPPATASRVWTRAHEWHDAAFRVQASAAHPWAEPLSIYEVHLGSWRLGRNYRELGEELGDYVAGLGFTHVELMPVMEHPLTLSWGYQVSGFYAPTARFGTPEDFATFIDALHARGLGVIFDWVPAHFPRDEWALARFDGSALYEHEDWRRGSHPDWGTLVFNHGRNEVRNFLLGSARHFLDDFHGDGLRVDAVASMLYLDYSRRAGEWVPNVFGGREDLEALEFLRQLNTAVHAEHPGVVMAAEESTAWPGVTAPVTDGGLGFGFKWNMGWMHDTLSYFSREAVHRQYHHHELTFASLYAFTENFILPLSHDEVVHGKRSLVAKMPGDDWQRRANLRALYGFMWAHPGKKLLFMGGEFAQEREWNEEDGLDWNLLNDAGHLGIFELVRDLNHSYRAEPALFERDTEPATMRWIAADDAAHNVYAFERRGYGERRLLCVANLSPVVRHDYRVDVGSTSCWREVLNTDSTYYGGSNIGNAGWISTPEGAFGELSLTLPPLATIWLVPG